MSTIIMKKKLYLAAQKNHFFNELTLLPDEKIVNMMFFNIDFLKKIILEESLNLLDNEDDREDEETSDDECGCCDSKDSCNNEATTDDTDDEHFHDLDENEYADNEDTEKDEESDNIDVDEDLLREYAALTILSRIAKLLHHIIIVYAINHNHTFSNAGDIVELLDFLEHQKIIKKDDIMNIATLFVFSDEATSKFFFNTNNEEDTFLTDDEKRISNVPVEMWYEILEIVGNVTTKIYK
jgi:hypothetical protein